MPAGSPKGAIFRDSRLLVSAWMRQNLTGVRAFDKKRIQSYNLRNCAAGWAAAFDVAGASYELDIILPQNFPYERARIALASENKFLVWPHVEEDGVICLPPYAFSARDPITNVKSAIEAALLLIEKFSGGEIETEFIREFVSYWARSDGPIAKGKPILTIFDPRGPGRPIRTWEGFNQHVVASDSKPVLKQWLRNLGYRRVNSFGTGLYLPLTSPIIPPYPDNASEFLVKVRERLSAEGCQLLDQPHVRDRSVWLVLSAEVDGKLGLIGARLECDKTPANYRKNKLESLSKFGALTASRVRRADANWVHGRDANKAVDELAKKKVAILGCGSLGSHVAVRLAQSGVGNFVLVDGEVLETSNVGRHILGISSVGEAKATSLAALLLNRFPHLQRVVPIPSEWETAEDHGSIFDADLIISAIGEFGPEARLNDEFVSRGHKPPLIFGWMEERAAAAHAFALIAPGSCLHCIVDETGASLVRETEWDHEDLTESEPACGAVFQPYGAIELGAAENLVADLALGVLTGKVVDNTHMVYATSTERLQNEGGRWTDAHMKVRPAGWQEAITFHRELPAAELCQAGAHSR